MEFAFKESVVLVTGGARGLGLAIGSAFATSGASVVLCDIEEEAAKRSAASLEDCAGRATGAFMDVSDAASVHTVFDRVYEAFGPVRILINNAGICTNEDFSDLSIAQWRKTMDVNLTGTFLCMKAAVPAMTDVGGGKIINIGSSAGRGGGIMVSAAYSSSKSAVGGLTKAAAKQLAPHNIQVNCIAPGTLKTDLTAHWDPKKLENIRVSVPAKRLGTVDDVVGAALFLASPAADYITGVTLDVNGGLYIAP